MGQKNLTDSIKDLAREFGRHMDVVQVFDPDAASQYMEASSSDGLDSCGSDAIAQLLRDPSKLSEFQKIDPEMPLNQKVAQMSKLFQEKPKSNVKRPAQASGKQKAQWSSSMRDEKLVQLEK